MTEASTDLVGPVPRRRITVLELLGQHREGQAQTRIHPGGSWSVVCECGDERPAPAQRPWHEPHREHVAEVLTEHADDVMRDLAARAWPEDPSPLEEQGYAAGRREQVAYLQQRRRDTLRALRASTDAGFDYWRWQGHAELSRQLLERMGAEVPQ